MGYDVYPQANCDRIRVPTPENMTATVLFAATGVRL